MDNILEQKQEALKAVGEYLDNLIPCMENLCGELKGDRQEDTEEFQKKCIDGLNWVIEIYNRITDIIAMEQIHIKKEELNESLIDLGGAIKEKNENKIAGTIESCVLPFLKDLSAVAKAAAVSSVTVTS